MRRTNKETIATAIPTERSGGNSPNRIKGLAQTIVKPTYIKLLSAEPFLRRGVPILVVAFIGTIILGAIVQTIDYNRYSIFQAKEKIIGFSEILSARIDASGDQESDFARKLNLAIDTKPGIRALEGGIKIFFADKEGIVAATVPLIPNVIGRNLSDVIAENEASERAQLSWFESLLTDNPQIIGNRRVTKNGQIYVYQAREVALYEWRRQTNLTGALLATTSFVVLVLGFAYHWQATRAREADQIYDIVRSRIDAALTLGRCGLWNWNLSTGQIYWSHSMFEILGLKSEDRLLSLAELTALIHPADIDLDKLRPGDLIDRTFRIRHVQRGWIWLRLRCELVKDNDETQYLIGAAAELSKDSERDALPALSSMTTSLKNLENELLKPVEVEKLLARTDDLVRQHVNSDGVVELVGLANSLGLKVYTADFRNDLLSSFSKTSKANNEVGTNIYLNGALPIAMRRWVLAKELAHYLGALNGVVLENDIDTFALELVLPSQQFKFAWEHIHDEEALGKWFQVPDEVVKARAEKLNLHQMVR